MADITWGVELDSLDHDYAEFRHAQRVTFTLPREEWEKLGKPSKLWITPKKGPHE